MDPSNTSGGLYHSVTTSLEYVFVGIDFALARPVNIEFLFEPHHEKTNKVVSDQILHKLACTVTEDG